MWIPGCLADAPVTLKVVIDRLPVQVVGTFHTTVNKAVTEARTKREGGDPDWWRPLEASLAVIGSQSEDVLTCVEDELDSGREKPINIDYLLVEVIPSFLSLDGKPDPTELVLSPLPAYPQNAHSCKDEDLSSQASFPACCLKRLQEVTWMPRSGSSRTTMLRSRLKCQP